MLHGLRYSESECSEMCSYASHASYAHLLSLSFGFPLVPHSSLWENAIEMSRELLPGSKAQYLVVVTKRHVNND